MNVVLRYVFQSPIFWAEELVRYLMVWVIFVGGSQATKKGGHVAVDAVTRLLSRKANDRLALAVNIFALGFLGVLFWYSGEQVLRVRAAAQTSPALEIPMWLVYLAIPIGSLLMFVRFSGQLARRLRGEGVHVEEVLD